MRGRLNRFKDNINRSRIGRSIKKYVTDNIDKECKESRVALGVLLLATGAVAEADGKFTPEERRKIEDILLKSLKINKEDLKIVITTIRQAAISKADYGRVALDADKHLSFDKKVSIVEDLFRVAYVDGNLDRRELKVINKVSDIFHISDNDFLYIRKRIIKEIDIEYGYHPQAVTKRSGSGKK
ncbi:MAG: TerB family tellurite resistance protein [Candidatus Omnitrophota bacterium]